MPSTECREQTAYERVSWLGMSLSVRRDWQIVRHSLNSERGKLIWIDRTRQRLMLSWAQLRKPIGLEQVFTDYRNRDREQDESCHIEPVSGVEPWTAYRRRGRDESITRAGLIDDQVMPHRWLEITLTWPDGVDEATERTVLGDFVMAGPNSPDARRWRALRMDVTAPEGWALRRVEAKPADVTFTFQRGRSAVAVRRLGMLEAWYDDDAHQWIRTTVPRPIERFDALRINNHTATWAESWERNRPVAGLLGLVRLRRDVVWRCDRDQALYRMTQFARRRAGDSLGQFAVRCCMAPR